MIAEHLDYECRHDDGSCGDYAVCMECDCCSAHCDCDALATVAGILERFC